MRLFRPVNTMALNAASALPMAAPNDIILSLEEGLNSSMRQVKASIHYLDEGGVHHHNQTESPDLTAKKAAVMLMDNMMQRICEGKITNVSGWMFSGETGQLPSIGFPHGSYDISELVPIAADICDKLEEMREANQLPFPSRLHIYGPVMSALSGATDHPSKHELVIGKEVAKQYSKMFVACDVGIQFTIHAATITVISPRNEDESATPFFTYEGLKTYFGL